MDDEARQWWTWMVVWSVIYNVMATILGWWTFYPTPSGVWRWMVWGWHLIPRIFWHLPALGLEFVIVLILLLISSIVGVPAMTSITSYNYDAHGRYQGTSQYFIPSSWAGGVVQDACGSGYVFWGFVVYYALTRWLFGMEATLDFWLTLCEFK
jgi:hypothetical protein